MFTAKTNSVGIVIVLFVAAMCLPLMAQQSTPAVQKDGAPLSLQEVLSKLSQAQFENRDHIRPYVVSREYRLYDGDSTQSDSQVIAEVSFVPPATKAYEITQSKGSNQGERVVRKVLAHEQEMAAAWEQTALTPENYNFELTGMDVADGHRCYVLNMIPKRDSKDLIRGHAWIDAETFNVRKMEGELAKSPSWWVKRVQLSLHFDQVQGMWLQTGAKANAEVRMFGKKVLTSHDLSCRASDVVAVKAKTLPRQKNFTRTIGAGMIVVR